MEKQEVPAPQIFDHEQFGQIRVVMTAEMPWFVAADVCRALDIINYRDAVARLDDDEKGKIFIPSMGVGLTDTHGGQEMLIVNEFGLYNLILSSRKPEAKKFNRWITHEVLPNLRKYGYYALLRQNEIEHPKLNDLTAEKFLRLVEAVENYKRAAYDYEAKQERIHELRNELLKLDNECKVLLAKKQDLIGKIDSSMQDFFAELKRNQLHLRV